MSLLLLASLSLCWLTVVDGKLSCSNFLKSSLVDSPSFTFLSSSPAKWNNCSSACNLSFPNSKFLRSNDSQQEIALTSVASNVWIALRQVDKLLEPYGHWVWLDGTALENGGFSNWNLNEPSNTGNEDCAHTYLGKWNDAVCDLAFYCGCQIEDRKHYLYER
jgi:hypothetical protein